MQREDEPTWTGFRFKALEPDPYWRHLEPSYLEIIKPRLWKPNGRVKSNGLRLMPDSANALFNSEYPWPVGF
jgi:hypothetical protein